MKIQETILNIIQICYDHNIYDLYLHHFFSIVLVNGVIIIIIINIHIFILTVHIIITYYIVIF